MYSVNEISKEELLCATWEIVNEQILTQKKHLILDRDGVIIKDYGYVNTMGQTDTNDAIISVMQLANSLHIPVTIITNQAGVAHGFYSEEELIRYNLQLLEYLHYEYNVSVNALLYCPAHPEAEIPGYRKVCNCRKPMTGLFERAHKLAPMELSTSIFVGDKLSDEEAAQRLGVRYWHYDSDGDSEYIKNWLLEANLR